MNFSAKLTPLTVLPRASRAGLHRPIWGLDPPSPHPHDPGHHQHQGAGHTALGRQADLEGRAMVMQVVIPTLKANWPL